MIRLQLCPQYLQPPCHAVTEKNPPLAGSHRDIIREIHSAARVGSALLSEMLGGNVELREGGRARDRESPGKKARLHCVRVGTDIDEIGERPV